MIEVKLEDFEDYREELLRYATGLLLSRGSANTKTKELTPKAEDIVQETYLDFHRHHQDAFVNEKHLENFIKMCLYRNYQDSTRASLRVNQYTILKTGQIEFLDEDKHPLDMPIFDETDTFRKMLNQVELNILNFLLEGYNQVEVAQKMSIAESAVGRHLRSIREKYLGTKLSSEDKEIIRVSKIVLNSQKAVKQIDHNGITVKVWDSGVIAAYELDLAASAISNCCKGRRLTHGGFGWSFVE